MKKANELHKISFRVSIDLAQKIISEIENTLPVIANEGMTRYEFSSYDLDKELVVREIEQHFESLGYRLSKVYSKLYDPAKYITFSW